LEILDFINEKYFMERNVNLCYVNCQQRELVRTKRKALNWGFVWGGVCLSFFSAQQDAVFELVSMGFNVALWYTKYASRLAGKEE